MPERLRASCLCVHDGKLLLIRHRDPLTHTLYSFPPGGGVEAGETPPQTAERETREETGYDVKADPASEFVLHYPFTWGGTEYQCKTHFFRATLISTTPHKFQPESIQEGVLWAPLETLVETLNYPGDLRRTILTLVSGENGPGVG